MSWSSQRPPVPAVAPGDLEEEAANEKISEEEFRDIQKIGEKYGLVYVIYRESDTIEVGDKGGRSTIYGLDDDVIRRIFSLSEGAFRKAPVP